MSGEGGGVALELRRLFHSALGSEESASTSAVAQQTSPQESEAWVTTEICERLLSERDSMWRQHEARTVVFLQGEHANMLTGLHAEIERLHTRIKGPAV